MRTFRFYIIVSALVCLSSLNNAYAQGVRPPHHGTGQEDFKGMPFMSAKERAEKRTQEMHKAVSLNDKQYKKIYKIFLKEENAKDSAIGNGGPMGPPPAGSGGPGAGGPPAGGMNGGGMRPKGGFPDGGPQKVTVGGKDIDSDEYIDWREEKFKKILSSEQYSIWRRLHPDPTGFFHK